MKKIKDERLILQNLKNIRIAFIFQSLGIIGILVYRIITEGYQAAVDSLLWLLFLLTGVILSWLNLKISVDTDEKASTKKLGPYYMRMRVLIIAVVSIVIGVIIKYAPGGTTKNAIILGAVIFVCFLISYTVTYFMRKKRYDEQ